MLVKLIKYDIKSLARKLLPFYGILIIIAILNKGFNGNAMEISSLDGPLNTAGLIILLVYAVTITVVLIGTLAIIINRFYINMFKDEGYLTNTLPVAKWQILLGKVISGLALTILSWITIIISLLILGGEVNFIDAFLSIDLENLLEILKFIGNLILSNILSLLTFYAVLSIGQLFKRKILMSFVAYIAIIIAKNIINGILSFGKEANELILNNIMSINNMYINNLDGVILSLVYIVIFFFITNYIIKNKLNLE